MNDIQDKLAFLLNRYATRTASEQEENELFTTIADTRYEEDVNAILLQLQEGEAPFGALDPNEWQPILDSILAQARISRPRPSPVRAMWKKLAVAASIIFIMATVAVSILINNRQKDEIAIVDTNDTDIQPPQSARATITLADGRTIALDSLTTLTQNGVTLVNEGEGKIVYDSRLPDGTLVKAGLTTNTLSNPRGSKIIDITLSDGSRVWLNAGSSLTYPVAFTGNERKVSITGEAYFEIAHVQLPPALAGGKQGVRMPFIVSKGDMQVQVLGTKFNVNAYDDEPDIKVTLLEGSVNVLPRASARGTIIKPGQQAIITLSEVEVHHSPDLDAVMAWKNGRFIFTGASIETIMKNIARWYNVEIVYEGKIAGEFVADISREVEVSQLLRLLELTNRVHFKIEDNRIIVKP